MERHNIDEWRYSDSCEYVGCIAASLRHILTDTGFGFVSYNALVCNYTHTVASSELLAPQNVVLTGSGTTINISWTQPQEAGCLSGYRISYQIDAGTIGKTGGLVVFCLALD